ncbi:hypothetical protein INT08_09540 [Prosthecochloris sp. N3]|uniref:DUF2267 domain-containing protein n=1 Tax=Prosthecochloris ethylica TaxID=2743976 RepID=A0ABR9XTL5_9CHLB|nr:MULTISPECIES: hypothetical protein [Prosthecochloris]MBF0587105.1 hypothetical protein [Prosthecochloris ethylica]MBF0637407.1 hypothetical protein [Prosthecochloris ethylica]NUK48047.1 hypothetical protein [Prosthecochloris ethylica]RNA64835.1 hypothetical protein CR163_006080 [Prosthecochloris sp. ZM_2]
MTEQKNPEDSIKAVKKLSLQFLAEVIGQCPAGLEQTKDQDVVFAVLGFQYGAIQSAAYVSGIDEEASVALAQDIMGRINGMDEETVSKIISLMPMLTKKEYPPIDIGGKAIIAFYNAPNDDEKLKAAGLLNEILRQIDQS